MFSRKITRTFSSARFASSVATKYARKPVPIRSATSATTSGTGNPNIVNKLPSTANEIEGAEVAESTSASESTKLPSVSENNSVYHGDGSKMDWSRSYHGLSVEPFPKVAAEILQAPLNPEDIEIKPGTLANFPSRILS